MKELIRFAVNAGFYFVIIHSLTRAGVEVLSWTTLFVLLAALGLQVSTAFFDLARCRDDSNE